ncbi:MAG: 5'-3' exonuclease H3TH domain-containing protein, partial [Planctomycetota bacterium]|nr:5'-3' exonuclease H3TH domain-containing protein [Planctomycetota bacterium]
AFDLPGPTFRHKLTDTYKANRDEMPVDLRGQISKIRELLGTLEMPILDLDGFEADDILATMAKLTSDLGGTCYLVTNDKDCRQLISPSVKLYNIRKARIYDEKDLEGDWGIRPDQVVDFQALVGDPVDNVPGVPLIGPKIAADLIQRFETLEGVFSNLDKVSGKKRKENLENGQAAAALSRQLVRLDPEVPIEINWQQGRTDYYNVEAALVQCKELGFRS